MKQTRGCSHDNRWISILHALPPTKLRSLDSYVCEDDLFQTRKICREVFTDTYSFDTYMKESIKSQTRVRRGAGVRRRVSGTSTTPSNWSSFFKFDEYKTELFAFLAFKVASIKSTNTVTVTQGKSTVSSGNI